MTKSCIICKTYIQDRLEINTLIAYVYHYKSMIVNFRSKSIRVIWL